MEKLKVYKENKDHTSAIKIDDVLFGNGKTKIIAGPCTIENRERLLKTAEELKEIGIHVLRAGAFKPRTSPYSSQGLREEGLKILKEVSKEVVLPTVTEVMAIRDIEVVSKYTDCLQVGTRNAQNFELLKELGKTNKPILLKRGMSQTLEEFLYSAEYILKEGNKNVILCERGIRTFENATRNVLDVVGIAWLKSKTHLPIIADPSHATGVRNLVIPASKAAIAAGADGLIVEASHDPENEICDKDQTISIRELKQLISP